MIEPKIMAIRPAHESAGSRTIARFDAELDHGIKVYDLKLVRTPSGHRVYGPSLFAGNAITFPVAVADQLATFALEAVARYEAATHAAA